METSTEIITIDSPQAAAEHGFFCYKSKPKSTGYARKLSWLEHRFDEGLRLHIVVEDGRSVGFVEYIPAELAWRPIQAPGYLFIHCIWVVGRAKKKGYGSRLLEMCVQDARESGKRGVAMTTKKGGHMAGKKLLLKDGFELVDRRSPFELVATTFGDHPLPAWPQDWAERQAALGEGLTVVYADQCPYFDGAVAEVLETADELGIEPRRAVKLRSAAEVQEKAPSPYGTYGIVQDGTLLSPTPLSSKQLAQRLQERLEETQ